MNRHFVITTALSLGLAASLALSGCSRSRNRGEAVEDCTPGDQLRISCGGGDGCGGRCTGDPTLTICDGAVSGCTRGLDSIGYDDDSCDGLCPGVTVTCPDSGSIRVIPAPYGSSGTFTCEWEVESLLGLTPD